MAKTLTKGEAILKTLKRAPKRGYTVAEISEKTGIKPNTVRSYISALAEEGYVQVVGQVTTGKRGRPALQYKAYGYHLLPREVIAP